MTERKTILGILWDRQADSRPGRPMASDTFLGGESEGRATEARGESPDPPAPPPPPDPLTKVRGESATEDQAETRVRGESTG